MGASAFSLAIRVLLGVIRQPFVQDIVSEVGRRAIRQASAALIRHIQKGTKPLRRSMPTVS